jgi:hypothetical protein
MFYVYYTHNKVVYLKLVHTGAKRSYNHKLIKLQSSSVERAGSFLFLAYKHNGDSEILLLDVAKRPMVIAVLTNLFTSVVLQRQRFETIIFSLSHRIAYR